MTLWVSPGAGGEKGPWCELCLAQVRARGAAKDAAELFHVGDRKLRREPSAPGSSGVWFLNSKLSLLVAEYGGPALSS